MQIVLKPAGERDDNAQDIIRRLGESLHGLAGIRVFMQAVQDLSIDDRVSRTQYQMTLSDPDRTRLTQWVPKLVRELQSLPQVAAVADDLQSSGLQTTLVIKRSEASSVAKECVSKCK